MLTEQGCTPCPRKGQCLPLAVNLQTRRAPSLGSGFGCTDETACNYDAEATTDDGSCDFASCLGCTDAEACNYNPDATVDDGSCVMPDSVDGCTDTCDFPVSVSEAALAQTAAGTAVEFGAYGTLSSLEVTLDWSQAEGTGAWPADLLVEIGLPDGSCVALVDTMSRATCTDLGNYAAVWPDTWAVNTAGTYTTSIDLSVPLKRHRIAVHHPHQWLGDRRFFELRCHVHHDGFVHFG